MVQNIELCGYSVPTPIQAYTIPAVLKGRDVIATAQTGGIIADCMKEGLANIVQALARLLLS